MPSGEKSIFQVGMDTYDGWGNAETKVEHDPIQLNRIMLQTRSLFSLYGPVRHDFCASVLTSIKPLRSNAGIRFPDPPTE